MEALTADAQSYFNDQYKENRFSFTLSPTISLEKVYSYYGKNSSTEKDVQFYEAVISGCKQLESKLDFSKIDYLLFLVPGMDESDSGSADHFWSHQRTLSQSGKSLTLDGRSFDDYLVITELDESGSFTGTGNLCHEFCHILGLQDYYDTDGSGSGGYTNGLWGELCLMDSGNKRDKGHNPPVLCAHERECLGIPGGANLSEGDYLLRPLEETGEYLRLTDNSNLISYFLECRKGGELMLTRIDESDSPAGFSDRQNRILTAKERWKFNEVNCRPGNECAKGSLHPGEGKTLKLDSLAITEISIKTEGVQFRSVSPIRNISLNILQDAIVLNCESGFSQKEISFFKAVLQCGTTYRCECEISDGMAIFKNLEEGSEYELIISVGTVDSELYERNISVKTKNQRENSLPFIYLDGNARNADGTFKKGSRLPLLTMNCTNARSIVWRFDGRIIDGDSKDSIILDSNGILSAEISDGDSSIIVSKQIIVKE